MIPQHSIFQHSPPYTVADWLLLNQTTHISLFFLINNTYNSRRDRTQDVERYLLI